MKYDRINMGVVFGGLALTIILSMVMGIKVHWALSLIFIAVYFVVASVVVMVIKRKSNLYLRQA